MSFITSYALSALVNVINWLSPEADQHNILIMWYRKIPRHNLYCISIKAMNIYLLCTIIFAIVVQQQNIVYVALELWRSFCCDVYICVFKTFYLIFGQTLSYVILGMLFLPFYVYNWVFLRLYLYWRYWFTYLTPKHMLFFTTGT